MTKILGFSMLLLAALVYSVQQIAEQKRVSFTLRSFCVMLEQMYGILEVQALPMPELLAAVSGCCEGPAAEFAELLYQAMDKLGDESFRTLWHTSLLGVSVRLDQDILDVLDSLGPVLGRFDLKTQLDAIASCRRALQQRQENLQRTLPQSKRLTLGISLSAAMLLGILLI